ncbi:MAG: DUF2191 domain-containing protein [Gammaproteobacteria bacterium]
MTIDDSTAKALKEVAHRCGKPFKQVLNETLRAGLSAKYTPKRYRLAAVSLGGVLPRVDLVKTLQIADDLEDEEISRKLQMKK